MAKVILYIATSIDGYIARKDGSIDWLNDIEPDPDEDFGYKELLNSVNSLLMGRKTYEQVLTFGEWPYKGKKCIVFTSKEIDKDPNVSVAHDLDVVKQLVKDESKDVWLVGGCGLNTSLLNAGLIDELIITIIPKILGSGIPLFNYSKDVLKFDLVDSNGYRNGFVQNVYKIKK